MKIKSKSNAGPLDVHIGKRVRMRRCLLGMSQTELADGINVSFQQIQKYEKGVNRISASQLYTISKVLNVDLEYFYLDDDNVMYQEENVTYITDQFPLLPEDVFSKKETHKFLESFYAIEDQEVRKSIITIMKNLTKKD